MQDRVSRDMEEGDISYFQALALKMEFIIKLVTAAVVACNRSSDRATVKSSGVGDLKPASTRFTARFRWSAGNT